MQKLSNFLHKLYNLISIKPQPALRNPTPQNPVPKLLPLALNLPCRNLSQHFPTARIIPLDNLDDPLKMFALFFYAFAYKFLQLCPLPLYSLFFYFEDVFEFFAEDEEKGVLELD